MNRSNLDQVMPPDTTSVGKITICLLVSLSCLATFQTLQAAEQQRVLWSADGGSTMRVDGDTRYLELTNNVNVTQGTLEITGDEAVFEYDAQTNELKRVTIHGSPVHYRQGMEDDADLVTGSSETVVFYRDEDASAILEFVGAAMINSPDSSMSCAAITYLAERDLIREAVGPCQGTLNPTSNNND